LIDTKGIDTFKVLDT